MNVLRRGVLVDDSMRSTLVTFLNLIVPIGASVWVSDLGHGGTRVIEKKEKEKEKKRGGNNQSLPYCKFEEGTPGCPALSNQAH